MQHLSWMLPRWIVLLSILFFWAVPVQAHEVEPDLALDLTDQEQAWLAQHPIIRHAPDPDYAPFEYRDGEGRIDGIAPRYLNLVAERLGFQVETVATDSWSHSLKQLQEGQADLVTVATRTLEREAYLRFTSHYAAFPNIILTRRESREALTLESLAGKRLAVIKGWAINETLQRDHPEIQLYWVAGVKEALTSVSVGTVDAVLLNRATAGYWLEKLNITNLRSAGEAGFTYHLGFASRKDWPILQGLLEKALLSISEETHREIQKQWIFVETPAWRPTSRFWWSLMAGVGGVVLLIILFWNRELRKQVALRTLELEEELEERRKAQMDLARFRDTLDRTMDCVFMFRADDFRFIYVNNGAVEQVGYSRDELLAMTPVDIKPKFGEGLFRSMVRPLVAEPGRSHIFETIHRHKNGHDIPVEIVLQFVSPRSGEPRFVAIVRDIAERKKNEEAIARLSRQNELILNAAGEGIYGLDREGYTTFINPAAARMLGWKREELIGCFQHDISHHSHSDGSPYHRESCSIYTSFMDGIAQFVDDEVFWRKDGSSFPVEYVSTPMFEKEKIVGGVVIFRDITERKQMEEALRLAKEEAESANRAKSVFLAAMSHEIRTPLNAILGMGELMKETKLSVSQEWCVNTSNRAGETLLTLINDILDLSKIEAGQLILEQGVMDLERLVDETVGLLTFTALGKEIELAYHLERGVPRWVRGDPTRLRQVLLNLMGNAVKFTQDGRVDLRVTKGEGEEITFSVEDTGPGVPMEVQESIFQPFTQADASTTRKHGGTGLGLTICRRLAGLMGGHISLTSELDRGTVFTFTVPLEAVADEAVPQKNITDALDHISAQKGHLVNGKRVLNILLVDDAEDNRLLVQAFLRNSPCRLEMAENGAEAVIKFTRDRYDLVLMDIQMPVMDGHDATRKIRSWEAENRSSRTPIVALTAHAMAEESEEIMAAGCDMHLTKPIRKERLLHTLERFMVVE
ncbi:MAG: transporter substrate-binding domain-containing protein [Magnetococcales bacterium]|nr:transporter substrate-binding domain-containing protein [Magnetococcales bacterium]